MGAHECTLLQSGLKVDEDFPSLLFATLEEVPAERVIASRTFITEGDVLRILDWLQHLPPQRRMMLDLSNHNVPIPRDKWGRAKHLVGWVVIQIYLPAAHCILAASAPGGAQPGASSSTSNNELSPTASLDELLAAHREVVSCR